MAALGLSLAMPFRGMVVGGGGTPITYATLNPADSGGGTLSNGDLTIAGNGNWTLTRSTIAKDADEWCCEVTQTNIAGNVIVGVCDASAGTGSFCGADASGFGYYSANGNLMTGGAGSALGATWNTLGAKVGIKFNATANTVQFYLNGAAQGGAVDISSLVGPIYVAASPYTAGDVITFNFGETPMTHDYSSANVGVFTS